MAEQYVKEYLSTADDTEGSLLIVKKIHDKLIEEVNKSLIPRTEAALYIGPGMIPGSSYDLDLETENTMDIREIAEGASITNDNPSYTSINLLPIKYGVGIRITKEMLEDGKWNLLQRAVSIAGKRFAENENSLVIAALDNAANTVSGGATLTVANVTRGMQYLEDSDFEPTTMAVGMEVANDIRNTDTWAEYDKTGTNDIFKTGFLGVLYGMKLYKVSTNAGMTTTTAYIWDRNEAYCIAEKRPITVENFDMPVYDMKAASITQRLKVRQIKTSAICKITTS